MADSKWQIIDLVQGVVVVAVVLRVDDSSDVEVELLFLLFMVSLLMVMIVYEDVVVVVVSCGFFRKQHCLKVYANKRVGKIVARRIIAMMFCL